MVFLYFSLIYLVNIHINFVYKINILGQKFAMLELKSIVSAILWNFELEAVDKPEDMNLMMDIVLRNKGPVFVKFKSRE